MSRRTVSVGMLCLALFACGIAAAWERKGRVTAQGIRCITLDAEGRPIAGGKTPFEMSSKDQGVVLTLNLADGGKRYLARVAEPGEKWRITVKEELDADCVWSAFAVSDGKSRIASGSMIGVNLPDGKKLYLTADAEKRLQLEGPSPGIRSRAVGPFTEWDDLDDGK